MAYPDDTISKPRRRHTDANYPTTDDIAEGELAVNTVDRVIYTRDDQNNIIPLDGISSHTDIFNNNTETGHIHRPLVTTSAATFYRVDADDENSLILFTSGTAVTVELALNATNEIPIGFIMHVHQQGAGQITIVPVDGVTANSSRSLATGAQYAALSLMKVGTDAWVVVGDQE